MCLPHSWSHILGATLTNGCHCGRWLYLTGSPAVPSLARHLSSSVIWRPSPLLWCTFHWQAVLWRTQYRRSFVILSDLTGPTHGRISPPLSDSSVQHYPVVTYDQTTSRNGMRFEVFANLTQFFPMTQAKWPYGHMAIWICFHASMYPVQNHQTREVLDNMISVVCQ